MPGPATPPRSTSISGTPPGDCAQHRDVHGRGDRADGRTGRRPAACAGVPGHHRGRQPLGLGSAVSARPVESPARRTKPTGETIARHPRRFSTTNGRAISGRPVTASSPAFASRCPGGDAEAVAEGLRAQLQQRVEPVSQGLALTPARRLALDALARRHRFRRVLHLLQLLHRRLGAAARGAVLPARDRAAAPPDRRAAGHRLHRASSPQDAGVRSGVIALAGGLLGVIGAVGYAALVVLGLRTWWVGAVGTTLLELHVRQASLAVGLRAA